MRPSARRRALLAAPLALAAVGSRAQSSFPSRPFTMLVGLQAGTGSDVAARNLAQKVSAAFGQPIVASNVLGAAGLLAAQQAAKAPADGYTLAALSGAAVTTVPHLHRGTGFDPQKDLVPVAMIVAFPSVISVNGKVPANSIAEFLALARANPGKYTYASGGNGSVQHTAMEQLKAMAGIDLLHVPYKGMAQATTDLVSGQVDCAIQGVVAVIPYVKTGQVRPLAWTGAKRYPLYPELPTLAEAGVTGYDFTSWTALFAPAGTPADVIEKLNLEFRRAAAAPDLREKWQQQAMEPLDMSSAQIAAVIRREYDDMGQLVRKVGIKSE